MRHRITLSAIVLSSGVLMGSMCGQESTADSGRRDLLTTPHSNEIHVDQQCRIYEIAPHTDGAKQHVYTDRGICDVGDSRFSSRDETDVDDAKRKHRTVTIQEHTFTLHNPTTEPVTFVVQQRVARGWEIDSAPPPDKMEGTLAVFLVRAQPEETVSLHVGERNPPRNNSQAPPMTLQRR
jgi:hypothetical protein